MHYVSVKKIVLMLLLSMIISARLAALDEKIKVFGDFPLKISGNFTAIMQGMSEANDVPESDPLDVSYSMDLFLESEIYEHGRLFLHLEGGEGANITDEATSLNGLNADALGRDADVYIAELFYEHKFIDDRFILTVGKLDPPCFFDLNRCAADEARMFLANAFVGSLTTPFQFYTPGVVGEAILVNDHPVVKKLSVKGGYLDANAEFEDFDDSMYLTGQIDLSLNIQDVEANVYLYFWDESLDRMTWSNPAVFGEANGWGLNTDLGFYVRPLLSNSQKRSALIGLFGRYSKRDGDFTDWQFDKAYSLGLSLTGILAPRPDDVFGLAFGKTRNSEEFLQYFVTPANQFLYDDEDLWEAYYKIAFNDRVELTPSLQWLNNRNGLTLSEDFTVYNLRLNVSF